MKKKLIALGLLMSIANTSHAEFWDLPNINGVLMRPNGTIAINIGSSPLTSPSPSNLVWTACASNLVYMHRDENGVVTPPKTLDRMLAAALLAYNKKAPIRLAFERDSGGTCFISQLYMFN